MPDGRVLSYGSNGLVRYDVWDPAAGLEGGHLTLPNSTDANLFCASQVVLPGGGGVFIAGGGPEEGTNASNRIFDYANNTLTRYQDLIRPRYYSTATTLLSGETYIQGGTGGEDFPEIRDREGSFRLLSKANTGSLDWSYPNNFLAPDGRVFGFDSVGAMYYVNTAGSGTLSPAGRFSGTVGRDATSAMFQPGRILVFGGPSNGARIVDIRGGSPAVSNTQPLLRNRKWANATILADGKVLATGGSQVANELEGVSYNAEIWNPTNGQWKVGANADRARLYHSTALLLPDATVLVAGGGNPGPQFNDNVEIYYPPYLYDAGGGWAPRPAIATAPSFLEIGENFAIDLADAQPVDRVALVKTGAVTHGMNMDQRFVELTFQRSGNQLNVQAPSRAADAPPGFYLLFVLNSSGTPSVARIVRIDVQGSGGDGEAPVLEDPGNQFGQVGVAATLQLVATDTDSPELTFAATGLPPGLAIDGSTGRIDGTPTTIGAYSVVVSVSDGVHGDGKNLQWTIEPTATTFVLHPPPVPAPMVAGTELTLEASVDGGTDLQYKWDFDDGTPETPYSSSPVISHTFATPGIHYVTVTASDSGGLPQVSTVVVTVHLPLTPQAPTMSTSLAVEDRAGGTDRLWIVNPDNDTVTVFNIEADARLAEIDVGAGPRAVAVLPNGEAWVTNKLAASISVIDSEGLAVVRSLPLPFASQPFGIAADPAGHFAYVALEALGRLLKIDTSNDTIVDSLDVGPNPRHVSVSADGAKVYVSRFITRPLPGESTANVGTPASAGGEVVVVGAANFNVLDTIILRHGDEPDFENQGRGVPNYLGAVAISPDGTSAWVPSKQDNVKRGTLRDGLGLTFQNTVRAISSKIDLGSGAESHSARIDHDDAGLASAIAFDRLGVYMFVALETSREVAVIDAHGGWEMFRLAVGRAPQALALSVDGRSLYVSNFMDRTVTAFDLSLLLDEGIADVPVVSTLNSVSSEKLGANVLHGKQLFYDARDARLARDRYVSCASCHNDGGSDGRVWDLTGFGEGLRNTVSLRGRGAGQGFLHWSANFDEVQDFEGQIRGLAGGTGLMTNAQFNSGTRSQPLGDRKAGVSADLDALAAYVASLDAFAPTPFRNPDGSLTASAQAGRALFESRNCGSCHGGTAFTNSGSNNTQNIGTITAASGKRLGGALNGIDVPTLRDAWATAPYLHLGSAATLADAIRAHNNVTVTEAELSDLVDYVRQIGSQEPAAPYVPPPPTPKPNTGTGLLGEYYNNKTLTGTPVLQRKEAINFGWASKSPGPGVGTNNFSVRWTGQVEATATGKFTFQTTSNDGVRLWVNGALVVDNWTNHATVTNNSPAITLTKNLRYAIRMEFYDNTGSAVAKLKWKAPGKTTFAAVPKTRLYAD
jgi:DNA-binding beta-propeller fold protein YncE/mono/diheme cytochrome c family protein